MLERDSDRTLYFGPELGLPLALLGRMAVESTGFMVLWVARLG
jgi:hypothetical protein